jgi:hypothetical protein
MVRALIVSHKKSLAPLLLDQVPQLPLHDLECIVHHFGQWLMRAVVHLFFFRDQLVAGRNGHIDADAKLIAFLVRMVGLLDRHIAPADVIAEFVETRGLVPHHLFDPIALVESAVSDVHWQLHIKDTLRAVVMPAQGHLASNRVIAVTKPWSD